EQPVRGQTFGQIVHYVPLRIAIKVNQDISAENQVKRHRDRVRSLAQVDPPELDHLLNLTVHLHLTLLAGDTLQHEAIQEFLGNTVCLGDAVDSSTRRCQDP